MQGTPNQSFGHGGSDASIGRIVSVTGSKAIVLLDGTGEMRMRALDGRPEMGTLLAIDTARTTVLAIVSALSVPVPSQRDGDGEVWIAELGLVGELTTSGDSKTPIFNRGVTAYPALGDRARLALRSELEATFCGDEGAMVRVGSIRQDSTIPAMVRVDELLGKHFAVLGTTGTGKSCTTALILRSIVEKNPAAHIVLLDPHNEYATAFSEWAEVISPRNMQLPYWLLTFEEILEVLVGDGDRKAEIEVLQELIPLAKARYHSIRGGQEPAKLRRGFSDASRYTVDTPVPYRISDLLMMLDERMGKLENKKDLAPYRILKHRIETISQDGRYSFMFGSLTVYDGMAQVLSRIFRVPVNNKPITILELTGIPSEVVNVVVSVLCRMTFDFALWSEGQVPVTLVCEEAHRYVPANSMLGFEPCKRAIAKIAKEGRKYGASLCIVTQRPAEIDPTILSQCNTVFALRMSNEKDQAIVASAVADTGAGLLEFLPSLGQREAIAFGDGMALPVRIKFDELPKRALPKSSTAHFSERWQRSLNDDGFLDQIVERWRASGIPASTDAPQHLAMMADALGLHGGSAYDMPPHEPAQEPPQNRTPAGPPPYAGPSSSVARPGVPPPRRDAPLSSPAGSSTSRSPGLSNPGLSSPVPDRSPPAASQPGGRPTSQSVTSAESLRSLRERLSRPS
jgi:DNA helicase HerA-like ATPase